MDANVLAELLLAGFRPRRPVPLEQVESRVRGRRLHSPQERLEALTRLLGACCILLCSDKLMNETFHACHEQGFRLPRDLRTWDRVGHAAKRQMIPKSVLESRPAPERLRAAFPEGDVHLIQLALAGGARWLVSDDRPVLETDDAVRAHSAIEIVDCTHVIEQVPAREPPCWRLEGNEADR